jgi:hypothetical protein
VRAARVATVSAPKLDPACLRALQLPESVTPQGKGDLEVTPELKDAADKRVDERWIDLVTGAIREARLYLAVAKRLFGADRVVIEQLDAAGGVLAAEPLGALSPVTVSGTTTGLPPQWVDAGGPWVNEVEPVATLLAEPALASLQRLWVTVVPKEDTVRLRIRVTGAGRTSDHPAVVLGVVELCRAGEDERAETEEASRSGQLETLAGYLNGSALVPLLQPNAQYTLQVEYVPTTEDTDPDGTVTVTDHPTVTESFRFRTDDEPPTRLDPYVLASNPRNEEGFVFAGDTVRIVFNDLQIVQLYASYGRELRAVLRAADGTASAEHGVQDLDEVPATFTSPLLESLDAMAQRGRWDCLGPHQLEGHGSFTLPVPLRPSMAYTLEIEPDPPVPAPADQPIVPLFRRSFTTGRFASLDDLVNELKARALEHRAITGALAGLPTGTGVLVATDRAIEDALVGAGLTAPAAPTQGGRLVLWRPRPGGDGYVPHALVLDASEPLWRFRDAPRAEVVPAQPDPSFMRVVPGEEPALHLEALAGSRVVAFVRSPSGTRTIVLLDDAAWPADGATVALDAVRPASALYGTAEERVTVTTIPLAGHAPWEDDA